MALLSAHFMDGEGEAIEEQCLSQDQSESQVEIQGRSPVRSGGCSLNTSGRVVLLVTKGALPPGSHFLLRRPWAAGSL